MHCLTQDGFSLSLGNFLKTLSCRSFWQFGTPFQAKAQDVAQIKYQLKRLLRTIVSVDSLFLKYSICYLLMYAVLTIIGQCKNMILPNLQKCCDIYMRVLIFFQLLCGYVYLLTPLFFQNKISKKQSAWLKSRVLLSAVKDTNTWISPVVQVSKNN